MKPPTTQVRITLSRIGKPPRTFAEGLVEDDGVRLRTFSIVPLDSGRHLSDKFQRRGWIPEGRIIYSVAKYYFYKEYFGLVELRDQAAVLLGYYCDLVTPLRRQGDAYSLTDLFLDLWVAPARGVQEIDREEFETAVAAGLVSPDLEQAARSTIARLKTEWEAGLFPSAYVR